MTTDRIYVGGTAGISPAASGDWDNSASMVRFAASTTKPNLSSATITGPALASGTAKVALLQIVYPLSVGTKFTSGVDTILGYFMLSRSSGSSNSVAAMSARVMASDGTTTRTTLMSVETSTTTPVIGTPVISKRLPSSSASATVGATYTSVSGDYLVIELGQRHVGGISHSNSILRHSTTGSTDLSGTEGQSTTTLCPWIEFTYSTVVDASATCSQGTLTLTGQGLVGSSAAVLGSAAQGALTFTGQALAAARLEYAPTASQGTLTLTGQALTLAAADGYAAVFDPAILTLEGQDAQASWEAPDTAQLTRGILSLTGKSLTGVSVEVLATIDQGTLTLTGQDATGRANVLATVAQGTLTLNGQSMLAAAILAAIVSRGTLTLTGKDLAISAAATTSTLTRGTLTLSGSLVVARQGFSFYQVAII